MRKFFKFLKNRLGEKGQGMVEYAIVLALVVVLAVALSSSGIMEALWSSYNDTADKIEEQTNQ